MADSSIIPRLSALVSLLALGVSSAAVAASWRTQRRDAGAPATPGSPAGAELEELEHRVAGLERQLEVMKAALALKSAVRGNGMPAAAAGTGGTAAAEMAVMAQRVAQLEQKAAAFAERWRNGEAHGPLPPEAVAAATRTLLDRQATVDQRAAALTLLRPNDGRADGRTHEVVTAALELLQAPETSPKLRAGMIRDLDKLRDPVLKEPLVGILSRDSDPRTRREAVETLAVFYDDAEVRALVDRLKDADPDLEVRAQAMKQLGRWQARGPSSR